MEWIKDIEIVMEWLKDIAIVIATGAFTVSGVIVGAKMSAKEEMRRHRYELLLETYSDIFSNFLLYSQRKDADSFRSLIATCEKAILICSEKPEKVLVRLIFEVSQDKPDNKKVYELIDTLRGEAKKELGKRY